MKHDCSDIEPLLERFYDSDLAADDSARLESHLRECHACRLALDQERQLRESFATLPEPPCPDKVTDRIVRGTIFQDAETSPGRRSRSATWPIFPWSFGWKSVVVTAAAAAIVLLLWHALPQQDSAPESPYTPEQILVARQQATWSLIYTVQVIDRSRRDALAEVLGEQLPQVIKGSLHKAWEQSLGGQG